MKYHTTFSTIVISLLVLLTFLAAVFFCIFSLNIDSPGLLLVNQLAGYVGNDSGFTFSYSSIDRNLSQKIKINDISIEYMGDETVHIDSLTLYQNPFSLIYSVITGKGNMNVDVDGLTVTLENLMENAGDGGSSVSEESRLSIDDVNRFINSIDERRHALSGTFFYDFTYSVNIENFDLRLGESMSFEDFRMNLRLGQELQPESFVFNAPYIDVSLQELGFSASNLSLRLDYDGSYRISFSLDSTEGYYDSVNASFDDLALILDFESLETLDVRHLPLTVSARSGKLSYGSYNASLAGISAYTGSNGFDLVLLSSALEGDGASVSLGRMDARIDLYEDEASLSVRSADGVRVSYGDVSLSVKEIDGSARAASSSLSFDLSTGEINADGTGGLTDDVVTAAYSRGITVSGQMNENSIYVEGSAGVKASSDVNFLDGSELDVSASAIFSGSKVNDFTISMNRLRFMPLDDDFTAYLTYNDSGLSGNLSYGDVIQLVYTGGARHDLRLSVNSFSLNSLSLLFEQYVPSISAYIDDATTLSGSLGMNFNLSDASIPVGKVISSFAFNNINFNGRDFGLASSLDAGMDDDAIIINSFTITSQWIRLLYSGSISYESLLPEGNLSIEMTESGTKVVNIDFLLDSTDEYYIDVSTPFFENSYLRGAINWAREGVVSSNGELKSGITVYPFDLSVDFNNSRADLISAGLVASLDYSQNIMLSLSFSDFRLPTLNPYNKEQSTLDGSFSYYFDVAAQSYYGSTGNFEISSLGFIQSRPDVSFSLTIDPERITFSEIRFSDVYGTYTGEAVYVHDGRRFAMTLGNTDERINLSLLLRRGDYSGILTAENVSLDRLGLADSILDTYLIGRGENGSDFSFSGNLYLHSSDENITSYALRASVILDNTGFVANDVSYSTDNMTLSSDLISFGIQSGHFSTTIGMHYDKVNVDRIYPVDAVLTLTLDYQPYDGLFELVSETIRNIDEISFDSQLSIDSLIIDGRSLLENRFVDLHYYGGHVGFDGNFVTGYVDIPSLTADLEILENDVLYGAVEGSFDLEDINLELKGINFDLSVLNWLYRVPLVTFENPAWVYGDFLLYGTLDDTHLYGDGGSHGFDMRVWWLENARIRVGNTQVSVVDNHATTNRTQVVVIDDDNGDLHRGFAVAQAMLSNADIIDYYDVEVWIPEGDTVFVRVPVYSKGIQIKGDVDGYFRIYSDLDKIYLSGDLNLHNAVFSMGMDPLPAWWYASGRLVRNEYDVTLKENCSFVMPLQGDPIIRAYFNEDNSFHFLYDNESAEIGLVGELSFRSGEIYYFQKNFFITEGNFNFLDSRTGELTPLINLRARLRDYDSDGERVDIYLVLNNASLDNFSPVFESTPQLSIEEIMSILGNSILPSTAYGSSDIGSIASLVTSGVDVLSRMGLINTGNGGNLVNIIRESLHVDIFSLRTNIIENFLLTTIFPDAEHAYSPLAAYLNNTSIYLGKYLSDNLYFQIMFYLQAMDNSINDASFLTEDLSLDLEISFEWENPLGTFTIFSTPDYLSLPSLMDNFGIRYTKTIDF